MQQISCKPFHPSENTLMNGFVDGSSRTFQALNHQLESLRDLTKRRGGLCILGIQFGPSFIARSRNKLSFKVGWGCGSEDYQLGDRRPFSLRDAVAVLDDGTFLCSELSLGSGRLQELQFLGIMKKPGAPLMRPPDGLKHVEIKSILFSNPWDPSTEMTPRHLSALRIMDAPYATLHASQLKSPSAIQAWLLSLENMSIELNDTRLPLEWRRAQPASQSELDAFETQRYIRLPGELRDIWYLTNGGSFFGDVLYGSYDAPGHRRDGFYELVLLERVQQPGLFIVARLPEVEPASGGYSVAISEIDIGTQQTRRQWRSLQECLRELLEERRNMTMS